MRKGCDGGKTGRKKKTGGGEKKEKTLTDTGTDRENNRQRIGQTKGKNTYED